METPGLPEIIITLADRIVEVVDFWNLEVIDTVTPAKNLGRMSVFI